MKNHELLDLIGDVSEDYVQAADGKVIRPKFRWKAVAACAACAVLVLGAYPAYQAAHPPLHDYTVMGAGGALDPQDDVKSPAEGGANVPGQIPPDPEPPRGEGPVTGASGGDTGGVDGEHYSGSGADAPVQEEANGQYHRLLQWLGGAEGREPDHYPDWFAGAWIDSSYYPEARLTVAIVDGFRTEELEAQITQGCGGTGDVLFRGAKYSHTHLNSLMDLVVKTLDNTDLSCGIGVSVTDNCLGVDLYSHSGTVPNGVLAELARLDPDGDAIRVRVFQEPSTADDLRKGPLSEPIEPADPKPTPTPVDGGRVYHGEDAVPGGAVISDGAAVPGGAQPMEKFPAVTEKEKAQPAEEFPAGTEEARPAPY